MLENLVLCTKLDKTPPKDDKGKYMHFQMLEVKINHIFSYFSPSLMFLLLAWKME